MTITDLAASLARASKQGARVAVEGSGTKRGWGSLAPPVDLVLSTTPLNALVEHRSGDLTATVQAGAPLAAVNRELARHGQWIPLDPPWADSATIGGIVATNDSGPRRHRFGTPRDLIIGVELVRIDGTIAKSGGIVVKNVAGYDLGRLMTGSFGCLAVIASATFKLYPIPPASRTVAIDAGDDAGVTALAEGVLAALAASQLMPTSVELEALPFRLLVRFESIDSAAEQQAETAARLAQTAGARSAIVAGGPERALWDAHAQRPWAGTGAVVKVTCLPAQVGPTIAWLSQALGDGEWEVVGRAAVGALLLRLAGDGPRQAQTIADLRGRFSAGAGSAVIVRGSDELKRLADVWGPGGDSLPMMRAVKRQFDPDGLLNPGRGPFGL